MICSATSGNGVSAPIASLLPWAEAIPAAKFRNYCRMFPNYPVATLGRMIDEGAPNIGFRCVLKRPAQ